MTIKDYFKKWCIVYNKDENRQDNRIEFEDAFYSGYYAAQNELKQGAKNENKKS